MFIMRAGSVLHLLLERIIVTIGRRFIVRAGTGLQLERPHVYTNGWFRFIVSAGSRFLVSAGSGL